MPTTQKLLTITEIAQELDLDETTIRFYRSKFERFIPAMGKGSVAKYSTDSLKIFRYINESFAQHLSVIDIEKSLQKILFPNAQQSILQQQKELLHSVSVVLEQIQKIMHEMVSVIEEMNSQRHESTHMKQQLANYEERIRILEEKVNRPFWKRLF